MEHNKNADKKDAVSVITANSKPRSKPTLHILSSGRLSDEVQKVTRTKGRTLRNLRKYALEEIEKKREVNILVDAIEGTESEEMTEMTQECGLVDTHILNDPFSQEEKTR